MSRKGQTPTRILLPDPKHGSQVIARFINMVMQSGKKSVAEKIVYGALEHIGEKNAEPIGLVEKALSNVAPAVEVKSRRVGGATYQVPVEVRSSRRMALAMRWVIEAARKRGENSMPRKLGCRTGRSCGKPRRRSQEARRDAPHGGSQQGVLALPLVKRIVFKRGQDGRSYSGRKPAMT